MILMIKIIQLIIICKIWICIISFQLLLTSPISSQTKSCSNKWRYLLGPQGIPNQISFYNIERKRISYSTIGSNNAYLQVYINLDPQVEQYQRIVYSFLDMIGFIGGIFELLKAFGYLLSSTLLKERTTHQLS